MNDEQNSRPTSLGDLAVILAAGFLSRDAIARLDVKGVFSVTVLCSIVLQDGDVWSILRGRSRVPSVCCHFSHHHGRHQKDLSKKIYKYYRRESAYGEGIDVLSLQAYLSLSRS